MTLMFFPVDTDLIRKIGKQWRIVKNIILSPTIMGFTANIILYRIIQRVIQKLQNIILDLLKFIREMFFLYT